MNFLVAQYTYILTFNIHVDHFHAECMGDLKAWEHVEFPCVSVELVKILNTSSNRAKSWGIAWTEIQISQIPPFCYIHI